MFDSLHGQHIVLLYEHKVGTSINMRTHGHDLWCHTVTHRHMMEFMIGKSKTMVVMAVNGDKIMWQWLCQYV